MKEKSEVVQEFNELVNMTAKELKEWLKGDESTSVGWEKEDGNGESIGHDSGRKIVEILESNPEKDPEKYTDDDVGHMRKVVSYCKRHLAQEEKANNEKPVEEVKKTKSYASLKNWGHDTIKKREANGGGAEGEAEEQQEEEEANEEKEEKAGEKRKAPDDQSGKSKKRETEEGPAEVKDDDEKEEQAEGAEEVSEEVSEEESEEEAPKKPESKKDQKNGAEAGNGDKAKGPKKGDTVSWNWGQGQPEGTVKEVNPGKTTIETKKGNKVSRKGDAEDPAVVLDTGKSEAVKLSHELNETEE